MRIIFSELACFIRLPNLDTGQSLSGSHLIRKQVKKVLAALSRASVVVLNLKRLHQRWPECWHARKRAR